MRRIWIALALLSVVAGLCAFSVVLQDTQIDALLKELDALEQAYGAGNLEESRRLAADLAAQYERRTAMFPCFISHDDMAESQATVATLAASLEEDNPEEFKIETARLRAQLNWLLMVDKPVWQNIL